MKEGRIALKVDPPVQKEVPNTPEERMKEIRDLPNKDKANFLPEPGLTFSIGPFVYRATMANIGKLRFSAELVDVVIEGVNDGSEKISPIIDPYTMQGAVKE